jgi:hypothetical protein
MEDIDVAIVAAAVDGMVCMTCALLHNFLRRRNTSKQIYSTNGTFDYEEALHFKPGTLRQYTSNSSRTSLSATPSKPSQEAKVIPKEFSEYFITNGAVEWQDYVN